MEPIILRLGHATASQTEGLAPALARASEWYAAFHDRGGFPDNASSSELHPVIHGEIGDLVPVFAGSGSYGSRLLVLAFLPHTRQKFFAAFASKGWGEGWQMMPWTSAYERRLPTGPTQFDQEDAAVAAFMARMPEMRRMQ